MNRTKAGRSRQDDQIDSTVDHLLIGVQTIENVFWFHLDAITFAPQTVLDGINHTPGIFGKGIADRRQFDVPIR